MTDPGIGSYTAPLPGLSIGSHPAVIGVTATATQLLLQAEGALAFISTPISTPGAYTDDLVYANGNNTYGANGPTLWQIVYDNSMGGYDIKTDGYYSIGSLPDVPGSIAYNSPWIIATAAPVPEPATLALLGSAVLGLALVYLRRRTAKA